MRVVLLVSVLFLAGCFGPATTPAPTSPQTSGAEPPETSTPVARPDPVCTFLVCLADPEDYHSQVMLERFGWHRITNDTTEDAAPILDGEWLFWRPVGGPGVDIYQMEDRTLYRHVHAYNLRTRELIQVTMGGEEGDSYNLRSHRGVVAYTESDHQGNMSLVLWNATTREYTNVTTGLLGNQAVAGFDGTWVLIHLVNGPRDPASGIWAYRLQDGYKKQLSRVPPQQDYLGGRQEIAEGVLMDGTVYLAFATWINGDTPRTRLVEHQLETRREREVARFEGAVYFIHHDERFIALSMSSDYPLYYYDTLEERSGIAAEFGNWPKVGAGILLYRDSAVEPGRGKEDLHALNLLTLEGVILQARISSSENEASLYNMGHAAPNGEIVVAELFFKGHQDLYWKPFTP
jgi:hypothetical protein